jgi:hypothetical protein
MLQIRFSLSTLLAFLLFSSLSTPTWAQEMFSDLLTPGVPRTSLDFNASTEPGMSGQKTSNPRQDQNFLLTLPLYQNQKNQYHFNWRWQHLHLGTDRTLADGSPIPNELYRSQFSLAWKHHDDAESFWGLHASYGSASDHLFDSNQTSTLSITGFYSTSKDPTARWVWFVNYSNNRVFLNNLPIPGFAYVYRPSEDFFGIFGLPFAFIKKNGMRIGRPMLFLALLWDELTSVMACTDTDRWRPQKSTWCLKICRKLFTAPVAAMKKLSCSSLKAGCSSAANRLSRIFSRPTSMEALCLIAPSMSAKAFAIAPTVASFWKIAGSSGQICASLFTERSLKK